MMRQQQMDFFIYSNTDANMTIALEYSVGLSAGLESGDIIGVFYTDNFGNLVCGGTAQWNNESLAILGNRVRVR